MRNAESGGTADESGEPSLAPAPSWSLAAASRSSGVDRVRRGAMWASSGLSARSERSIRTRHPPSGTRPVSNVPLRNGRILAAAVHHGFGTRFQTGRAVLTRRASFASPRACHTASCRYIEPRRQVSYGPGHAFAAGRGLLWPTGVPLTNRRRSVAASATYRRNAARVAAAVELKYSGGSMKPHSLNAEPLVRARR